MKKNNQLLKSEAVNIFKIVLGCFLYSLSVVLFIDPVHIIPGSVTGIGVVVKALTGISIGTLNLVINIPLVIWGTIVLGKRLLVYTGLTVLLNSLMIDGLAFLPAFTEDVLLASVIGAVVMGVGLGLILDGGGSTGGTTVVGHIVTHKKPDLPMGTILLIGDFIIIMVGSMFLKNWDLMLYSVIDLYVCVVVIDKVMYNYKTQSTTMIVSDKAEQIAKTIAEQMQDQAAVVECDGRKLIVSTMKKDVVSVQKIAEGIDEVAASHSFNASYRFGKLFKNAI